MSGQTHPRDPPPPTVIFIGRTSTTESGSGGTRRCWRAARSCAAGLAGAPSTLWWQSLMDWRCGSYSCRWRRPPAGGQGLRPFILDVAQMQFMDSICSVVRFSPNPASGWDAAHNPWGVGRLMGGQGEEAFGQALTALAGV